MIRKLLSTASILALLCLPADAANWPSVSGSTAPGAVLEDGAGNKITGKSTYRWALAASSFAATFTDVWVIGGSASKVVRVNFITLCATATAAGSIDTYIVKRSTADTGGTSSAFTAIPSDSTNAAATGTVLVYTANPSGGAAAANFGVRKLNIGTLGNAGCVTWTFGPPGTGQSVTLRGVAQQLAVNFAGGAVPSGLLATIEIETTEE
jgi:hypothetical protein